MPKFHKPICWVRNVNGKICNKLGVVKVTEPDPEFPQILLINFYCEQHKRLAELKAAR